MKNLEISIFLYIFAQMEVIYKGFTVKDDGTVINRFGKKVGFKQKNGYMHVSINGKQVLIHRFIYEAFNGEIPEGYEIDHKNTVRDDNRLENLRIATPKENRNNPITKERYKTSNKGKVTPQLIEKLKLMYRQKSDTPKTKDIKPRHKNTTPKTTYNKPKTRQNITKELKKHKPMKKRIDKRIKSVYQYTKDGEFIKKWDSINECSAGLGIWAQNITRCCHGRCKSCGGFKFSFNQI